MLKPEFSHILHQRRALAVGFAEGLAAFLFRGFPRDKNAASWVPSDLRFYLDLSPRRRTLYHEQRFQSLCCPNRCLVMN